MQPNRRNAFCTTAKERSTQHTTYGTCGKATDDGVTNLDSHFGERCAREIGDLMARSPFRASVFAHV